MLKINIEYPVMVSGATGYVAGVLIQKLLREGFTVHAAVRNPENSEKLKYLNNVAKTSKGRIKYFKADLLDNGSYEKSMQGCEVVFHTASPFFLDSNDPQKELVEPAQLGTRNVLESVNNTESVTRVILTSSCAAIYGDNIDLQNSKNNIFTEADWNTSSSLNHNPYSYSKMLAEKAAWEICEKQDRWSLVTINPSLVVGPGINPFTTSESYKIIKQFGDGTMKAGLPDWGLGVVDVRDVADAHYNAAFTPQAHGRYIVSGHNTSFPAMAKVLYEKYGSKYLIPNRTLPKWFVWLVGPIVNRVMTRKAISKNVNFSWVGDNSKGIKQLGISYRPFQESLHELFQQMVNNGIIK